MNWTQVKQWLGGAAQGVRRQIGRVAPKVDNDPQPGSARSPQSTNAESAAEFWVNASYAGTAPAHLESGDARSRRIRSWRRRALLRKGARLHSTMAANADPGALAMLDEGGVVISWYERSADNAAGGEATGRVVNNHMSQFYLPADLALGLPVRDLCSAAIHGHSTQMGWRRYPEGEVSWATTVIKPILLRDGRLQGFSHLTRRVSGLQPIVRSVRDKSAQRRNVGSGSPSVVPAAMLAALALMIAVGPAIAATPAVSSLPEHARKNSYGSGWDCENGYRRVADGCALLVIPSNAYLDASGSSWTCERGYINLNNACAQVKTPSNAYLDSSYGTGWRCERGYREAKGACVAIEIPANAYADDSSYGSGWACERGYRLESGACTQVIVPINGYLTRTGDDWKCTRGFMKIASGCSAVELPANSYLDTRGDGWACERGFRKGSSACETVAIPPNAHLSYSGDNWRCDSGFLRQGSTCVAD